MDVSDSEDALTVASPLDTLLDTQARDTDPDADADADGEFVNAASDDEEEEEPPPLPSTSAITEAKANPGLYGLRRSVSGLPGHSPSSLSFMVMVQSRSRDNGSEVNSVSAHRRLRGRLALTVPGL
jgi:hypothetical protein